MKVVRGIFDGPEARWTPEEHRPSVGPRADDVPLLEAPPHYYHSSRLPEPSIIEIVADTLLADRPYAEIIADEQRRVALLRRGNHFAYVAMMVMLAFAIIVSLWVAYIQVRRRLRQVH